MLTYQCWCFDFDGTLIDIRNKFTNVYQDLVSSMGGQPVNEYFKKRYSGVTEKDIFLMSGLKESQYSKYDSLRESLLEEPQYLSCDHLFKGVLSLLKGIRERGSAIWIVTHRYNRITLQQELKDLNLLNYIDDYACTGDKQYGDCSNKHPDWFQDAAMQKSRKLTSLSQRYSRIVMVGDSPTDIEAANKADVSSVALPTGLFNSNQLIIAKPSFIFPDIIHLAKEIDVTIS
jgi:phosphoglycolate phosphatase-like HAD superfamily hydrolase